MMIDVWRVMYRRMMSGGLCRVLLCVGLGFWYEQDVVLLCRGCKMEILWYYWVHCFAMY